jgi:hypothetical protein
LTVGEGCIKEERWKRERSGRWERELREKKKNSALADQQLSMRASETLES